MLGCKSFFSILAIFIFGDFVLISLSNYFAISSIGVVRDLLLFLFAAIAVGYKYKIKKIIGVLITLSVIFSTLNLYDNTIRVLSLSILALGLGMLTKFSRKCLFRSGAFYTTILLIISIYQYLNYNQFSDFWFYNHFINKYGSDYLTSVSGYIADDGRVRIVGPLISPGIYGNLLLGLIVILHLSKSYFRLSDYFIMGSLIALIYLTYSRASQLGLFLYFSLYFISSQKMPKILGLATFLVYIFMTFIFIFLSDDASAIHRLLIWLDFFSGQSTSIENSVMQTDGILIPRDSQFVAFLQSNFLLACGYLFILAASIKWYLNAENKYQSKLYSLVLVYFYISIFQWIGDTAFTYITVFLLGNYFGDKVSVLSGKSMSLKYRSMV